MPNGPRLMGLGQQNTPNLLVCARHLNSPKPLGNAGWNCKASRPDRLVPQVSSFGDADKRGLTTAMTYAPFGPHG